MDLDEHLAQRHARLTDAPLQAAGALFTELGEPAFRAREWAALQSLLGSRAGDIPARVIAT